MGSGTVVLSGGRCPVRRSHRQRARARLTPAVLARPISTYLGRLDECWQLSRAALWLCNLPAFRWRLSGRFFRAELQNLGGVRLAVALVARPLLSRHHAVERGDRDVVADSSAGASVPLRLLEDNLGGPTSFVGRVYPVAAGGRPDDAADAPLAPLRDVAREVG